MLKKNAGIISTNIDTFINGLFVIPVLADNENIDTSARQFEIIPYLFVAGMDGTAEMRGISADIDMSFGDIWERLDKAFMVYITARKGDWIMPLTVFISSWKMKSQLLSGLPEGRF